MIWYLWFSPQGKTCWVIEKKQAESFRIHRSKSDETINDYLTKIFYLVWKLKGEVAKTMAVIYKKTLKRIYTKYHIISRLFRFWWLLVVSLAVLSSYPDWLSLLSIQFTLIACAFWRFGERIHWLGRWSAKSIPKRHHAKEQNELSQDTLQQCRSISCAILRIAVPSEGRRNTLSPKPSRGRNPGMYELTNWPGISFQFSRRKIRRLCCCFKPK